MAPYTRNAGMPQAYNQNSFMPQMNYGGVPPVNSGGLMPMNYDFNIQAPQVATQSFLPQLPSLADPNQMAVAGAASNGVIPPAMDTGPGFLSTATQQGWGMPAIAGASALLDGFLGIQNLGVAKDQLSFQKDAFNKNYAQSLSAYNQQLADNQAARTKG